jgi:hypothetical protein
MTDILAPPRNNIINLIQYINHNLTPNLIKNVNPNLNQIL